MSVIKVFATTVIVALVVTVSGVMAQGTSVAFGGLKQDPSLPVEVTADSLNISQADGTAVFSGNVLVGQGEMRMSASKIRVEYATENGERTGKISKMLASGGVTLVNGAEAAEAKDAVYDVVSGTVVMTGDVILTQGNNALSSDKMTVDLKTGLATMSGRVKTIFVPTEKNKAGKN